MQLQKSAKLRHLVDTSAGTTFVTWIESASDVCVSYIHHKPSARLTPAHLTAEGTHTSFHKPCKSLSHSRIALSKQRRKQAQIQASTETSKHSGEHMACCPCLQQHWLRRSWRQGCPRALCPWTPATRL